MWGVEPFLPGNVECRMFALGEKKSNFINLRSFFQQPHVNALSVQGGQGRPESPAEMRDAFLGL